MTNTISIKQERFKKYIKPEITRRLQLDVNEDTNKKILILKKNFNVKTDAEFIRASINYLYETFLGESND